jgi:Fe-Mn family superoxide dismutase
MFTLPTLPYDQSALEPHISARTLDFHHSKHHNTYVVNTNNLVKGTDLENETDMIKVVKAAFSSKNIPLFNNSAQSYNHDFYWKCMMQNGGSNPSEQLLSLAKQAFGSFDEMVKKLQDAALTQFGSGWGWLVYNKNTKALEIQKTSNAETPITTDHLAPLLTVDVWEHAYYLDHQNRRIEYLDKFFSHLVNWKFAEENLIKAINS